MRRGAIGCIAILAAVRVASAHEVQYSARLSGAAQNPPNSSTGHALALVTLDLDLVTMDVQLALDEVGATTSAAIHGLTSVPGTGSAISAVPMPAFPTGVTVANYQQTIDLAASSTYTSGFVSASGGTISDALN